MKITDWIKAEETTVAAMARRLGIAGVNPHRTLQRYATGERSVDADMVARIEAVTGGKVTAADMHETRLAWLRAHHPERLEGCEVQP